MTSQLNLIIQYNFGYERSIVATSIDIMNQSTSSFTFFFFFKYPAPPRNPPSSPPRPSPDLPRKEAVDDPQARADPHGPYDNHPAPGHVAHDHPRDHDPKAAADPEHRRDEPDRHTDLLPRKLVTDDPVAQREHRRTCALDRPPADQRPDVPGGSSADRTDEEEREGDHEQPFFAVLVAELAEDRGRDRGHEQKDRQYPRDPGRGRVQVPLQGRQSGDHHRLLECERDPGECENRERHVVMLALDFHWAFSAYRRRLGSPG